MAGPPYLALHGLEDGAWFPDKARSAIIGPDAGSHLGNVGLIDPSEAPKVPIWATKGPQFWAFLSALLIKSRPQSIVEFGTGRSTTFLADYASRSQIRLVAIEQSDVWYKKVTDDLKFMNIRGSYVHLVPLVPYAPGQPPWYDLEIVERILGDVCFDFVFVDGPQGAARRSPRGQQCIMEAARSARLIIVDDVHRPYNLAFFDELAARFPPDGRFLYSYNRNILAVAADEWRDVVRSCFEFSEMSYSVAGSQDAMQKAEEHE